MQQPDGQFMVRQEEMPCPRGCGGTWRHPAREAHLVVDAPSDAPTRVLGQAHAANQLPPALDDALQEIFKKFGK